MKKVIYIGVIILLVVLAGYTLVNNKNKNIAETAIVSATNSEIAVRVDEIKSEKINADFTVGGNFAPFQELSFAAENSGRIVSVLVKEGDRVIKGQTLAILKGDQLSIELENANVGYQNALADDERFEKAYETGGVTKQQADQAKLNLSNAKSRLDRAQVTYGDAIIKSSIDGIINKKSVEPGSVVSSGTILFEIVNVSKLKLKVNVNETQIADLKRGHSVKVKASVYPNKEFDGKITFIAPKADAALNFPVEIEIENNANHDLKAGMYGIAYFSNKDEKPILTVPRDAYVQGINSNEVYIIKDNTAYLTKIVSGRNFGKQIEVLSGLKEGDVVVVTGQINLTDGAKVTILK